jgi:hypothetical protein
VIWEKNLYTGRTIFKGTAYRPAEPPDLAARMGLNIGPVWINLAVVILGSLAAGVPLTAVNVFLVGLLILLWVAVSRLITSWLRWPVFTALAAAVLAWAFAIRSTAPGFIYILTPWDAPYGWIAVAGAVFVSAWAGIFLLRHQDSWFRASAMAVIAIYFLAALSAAVGIQGVLAGT